jgi:uncharacterized protein YbjT (DUF2867 family)
MAATRDVGAAAARALSSPPPASQIVNLEAPSYTEREVAQALGAALGKTLQVVTIPRPDRLGALTDAGVPPLLATELVELYDAENTGLLRHRGGDRREQCTTELADTLHQIVRTAAA